MDLQVKGQKKRYPKWVVCTLDCTLESSQFSSVQSLSRVRLFATPWIAAHQASLSITNCRSSPKVMCIESVMPSSHLNLCRPLLLLSPIPPSIRVFPNESTLRMRWPEYWSFSFSSSPSKENQDWSPLEWTGWISLQSRGLSRGGSYMNCLHPSCHRGRLNQNIWGWEADTSVVPQLPSDSNGSKVWEARRAVS